MVASLTSVQNLGLVFLLVSTPFLIKSVLNLHRANVSKRWPKVSGTIKAVSAFGRKHSVHYEYTVNREAYKGRRICFTNTNAHINEGGGAFQKKYTLDRIVDVYYDPKSPKRAVLEPGRRDGLLAAIVFLGILFVSGCFALFNQDLFVQIIGPYAEIR